jgi:hypothetical protein
MKTRQRSYPLIADIRANGPRTMRKCWSCGCIRRFSAPKGFRMSCSTIVAYESHQNQPDCHERATGLGRRLLGLHGGCHGAPLDQVLKRTPSRRARGFARPRGGRPARSCDASPIPRDESSLSLLGSGGRGSPLGPRPARAEPYAVDGGLKRQHSWRFCSRRKPAIGQTQYTL